MDSSIPTSCTPKVSIVVVNWNGKDVLRNCLASIEKLAYPISEVIVVDNGSTDDSVEMLRREYPGQIYLIALEKNFGAPKGRNVGVTRAVDTGVDFVFCLDNDLTIAPDAITRLLEVTRRDSRIAMVGALILRMDKPDIIFSAGHVINWKQNLVGTLGSGQKLTGQFKDIWDVHYVGSGAVLIRSDYIRRHGMFDESYIGYGYEDTEYGYRAINLGYRVVCCADARTWHQPHSGIGRYSFRKKYLETRNAVRFIKRYGTIANWLKYLGFVIPGFAYAFVREGARGYLPGVIGKVRGFIDGLRNRDDLALRLLNENPKKRR
jgi:GT2 family glycosyltransferase